MQGVKPTGFTKPPLRFPIPHPPENRLDENLTVSMKTYLTSLNVLKKSFKQHSGLSPDSFKEHQNDPMLNSAYLEGLDEMLVTLIEQHELNWSTTYVSNSDKLAILAHHLFEMIQRQKRIKLLKL